MHSMVDTVKQNVTKWYFQLSKSQKNLFYLLTFNLLGSTFITIFSYFTPVYFSASAWAVMTLVSVAFMYRFVSRTHRKQKVVKFG